jgi:hypothetical protein
MATPGGVFEIDVAEGDTRTVCAIDTTWRFGRLTLVGNGVPDRIEQLSLALPTSPAACPFRLRVLDRDTQQPVPGAHVNLSFCWPSFPGFTITTDALQMPSMQTDTTGCLVLPHVAFEEATAWVRHPHYVPTAGVRVARVTTGLDGVTYLTRQSEARTITCRAASRTPVVIDDHAANVDERTGLITLSGFADDADIVDISYRPRAAFSRRCSVSRIPVGSRDVPLPLYEVGDLVVNAMTADGPLPGALLTVAGADFSGTVWREDPRGCFVLKDVPAGQCNLSVFALGWARSEPQGAVVSAGASTNVSVRMGEPLPIVAVRLRSDDGDPLEGSRIVVLDEGGRAVAVDPGFEFLTLSDGWCYVPVEEQVVVLRMQNRVRQSGGGADWGPMVDLGTITVPRTGVVDVHRRVFWHVIVSDLRWDAPASGAGVKAGDIIELWDGNTINDVDDCRFLGSPVRTTVRRHGVRLELTLPADSTGLAIDRLYVATNEEERK